MRVDRVILAAIILILVVLLMLHPTFAGSNPVEVDGFFKDVKILSTYPPGGTLNRGSRV